MANTEIPKQSHDIYNPPQTNKVEAPNITRPELAKPLFVEGVNEETGNEFIKVGEQVGVHVQESPAGELNVDVPATDEAISAEAKYLKSLLENAGTNVMTAPADMQEEAFRYNEMDKEEKIH